MCVCVSQTKLFEESRATFLKMRASIAYATRQQALRAHSSTHKNTPWSKVKKAVVTNKVAAKYVDSYLAPPKKYEISASAELVLQQVHSCATDAHYTPTRT